MSVQRFVSGSREQVFLLPPDMREWLPEDHLAWVVVEAVGRLDLSGLLCAYRADANGRPAYDPGLMVALLLYGYATGERSSRVIERRCCEDVAMRVVCAGLCPDHATIARFRRRHAEALIGLFGQVLALCRLAGLGRLGTIGDRRDEGARERKQAALRGRAAGGRDPRGGRRARRRPMTSWSANSKTCCAVAAARAAGKSSAAALTGPRRRLPKQPLRSSLLLLARHRTRRRGFGSRQHVSGGRT